MKRILQPDLVLAGTIINITPEILAHYDLQGLVLDVDDTLVPWREKEVSEELLTWIEQIKQKAIIWLASNNINHNRISRIANRLQVPYISGAGKPSRRKLKKALEQINLPPEQVAMVGDRLFTDVVAGNRLGMFTILVEPMVNGGITPATYPWHHLEFWLSTQLGVSLTRQHNFTELDKK